MGWMKATPEGFAECRRPPGNREIVYIVGRHAKDLGAQWNSLHRIWDGVVPGFDKVDIYALTEAAVARIPAKAKYTLVPLADAAAKWLDEWAKADPDQQMLGPEMLFLHSGLDYLKRSATLAKVSAIMDEWDCGSFYDLLVFLDDTRWVHKHPSAPGSGPFGKLLERLALRSSKARTRPINGIVHEVNELYTVLCGLSTETHPNGGGFLLSPEGEAAMIKNYTLIRDLVAELCKDRPEIAILLGNNCRWNCYEAKKTEKWSAKLFEVLSGLK